MHIHRFRFHCRRAAVSLAIAASLALLPLPGGDHPALTALTTTPALAQGGMDIGIVSPAFSDLPESVQPGQEFIITAVTAPGARCGGWLMFRNHPLITLDAQLAPARTCSWTVTVPLTTRPGSATIGIDVSRNGQQWALYGVTYVTAVGESR
ncbi:MAG: hypothetical protein AB7K36_16895 [Chloroflexota bacterium]